jgi:hypothetical protein
MANDDRRDVDPQLPPDSEENDVRPVRRRILKAGALLVPTIVTLHATPAWAQTDYTLVAYRYGVNAGLCRNPNYNPNANPNSTAGQEFIECPNDWQPGRPHVEYEVETQTPSGGASAIGD